MHDEIDNWFGAFHGLEKGDIWKTLTSGEREYFEKIQADQEKGINSYATGLRAFDDMSDPENTQYIAQQLNMLSNDKPLPSENSFESGSGHYESDAAKLNMSDDEDL